MTSTDKTYMITQYVPEKLSAFIGSFTVFYFTDTTPVMMHPEGFFEMIFQIDCEIGQTSIDADDWQRRPLHFIGGLHNRSYLVKPARPGAQLISVRFKPDCAKHFIHDRLNLFKNRVVDLSDVFSPPSLASLEPVLQSGKISQSIRLIETLLMQNFRESRQSVISRTVEEIYRSHGFINVADLAQKAFLSNPQFRKRFNEEVGMSPKEYSKIVRINHITGILASVPEENLTQLTYRLGYFDQAHFIRDFSSVTGLSPKHFLNLDS